MPSGLTVIKIGGSVLRDGDHLRRAAAAVAARRRDGETLLVVVSALSGVTNLLERSSLQALNPGPDGNRPEHTVADLRRRHEEIARGLDDVSRSQLRAPLDELARLIAAIRASATMSERRYARLLSLGERLSVPLMAAAIRAQGQDARAVTSEEVGLRVNGPRCSGRCDLAASAAGLRGMRTELRDRVMVLTGFYGLDRDGDVVLLGRGGSDDTAGAVAAGLDAAVLEMWKDVQGFMSADPRYVKSARLVPDLSFDEVAQLGELGSRIVHHGSLEPLQGKPTEIRICALGGANPSGTRLVASRPGAGTRVAALSVRPGRAEFRLRLGADDARGLPRRLLGTLDEAGIAVETVTASRSGVRFTVAEADLGRVEPALHRLVDHRLAVERLPTLLGAVGDRVATEATIGSRMRARLADLRIRGDLAVRPSGHAGLSCALHPEDLAPALNGLHELFFDGAG